MIQVIEDATGYQARDNDVSLEVLTLVNGS